MNCICYTLNYHHDIIVLLTYATLLITMTLYINRFLPDKAIDLVDEAAAKLNIEVTSKPQEIDELDRKLIQLQMERLSIARDEAGKSVIHSDVKWSDRCVQCMYVICSVVYILYAVIDCVIVECVL